MDAPLIGYTLLACAGIAQAALFTLHLFENRRFARARCRRVEPNAGTEHVQIFAPCKGHDTGLRQNLAPLLQQAYPNYEVTFIVESAEDPAIGAIEAVIAGHPQTRANVCIAGLATDCGQKVHNLRRATSEAAAATTIFAFVDSDARPRADWLTNLTARLNRPETGAVSGYRWFVPERASLANYLLSGINAAVAGLIGPGGHHFVWGGSWAIRRETFDKLRINEAWQGTLSDDLVVTRVLQQAQLKIEFEPKCLVASPLETNLAGMLEFLRRQYVVGRFYSRRWWAGALLVSTLSAAAFWGSVAFSISRLARGQNLVWVPLGATLVLWCLHAIRAWFRQQIAQTCLPEFKSRLAGSRSFDILAAPLCGLVNWIGLIGSLVGRTIT